MIYINVTRQLGRTNGQEIRTVRNFSPQIAKHNIEAYLSRGFHGIHDEVQEASLKIMDKPKTRFLMNLFGMKLDNLSVKIIGKISASYKGVNNAINYADKIKFSELKEVATNQSESSFIVGESMCNKSAFLNRISNKMSRALFR